MYYVKDEENRRIIECETVDDIRQLLKNFNEFESPMPFDEMPFTIRKEGSKKVLTPSELGIFDEDEEEGYNFIVAQYK